MLGFVARTLGAGALFWAMFPLWLALFWSVQGYPPTLSDLPRWYALGAFNAAPIVGMVLASPLVLGVLAGVRFRFSSTAPSHDSSNLTPLAPLSVYGEGGTASSHTHGSSSPFTERRLGGEMETAWEIVGASPQVEATHRTLVRGLGVRVIIFSTLLYALLAPPLAYILLLIYAEMWQYRAWDAMTPTLLRAYLLLAPACGGVGALIGWTLKK